MFAEALRSHGIRVAAGEFGARMAVELVNDGPVTIVLADDLTAFLKNLPETRKPTV